MKEVSVEEGVEVGIRSHVSDPAPSSLRDLLLNFQDFGKLGVMAVTQNQVCCFESLHKFALSGIVLVT